MRLRKNSVQNQYRNIAATLLLLATCNLSGCAVLHHIQVGDVEVKNNSGSGVDVKVSETGINLDEAASVARGIARNRGAKDRVSDIENAIGMFQVGPRTGNPVYVETYAAKLLDVLQEACPKGRITNLLSIRETRKYPVISGEIVKVTGRCIKK